MTGRPWRSRCWCWSCFLVWLEWLLSFQSSLPLFCHRPPCCATHWYYALFWFVLCTMFTHLQSPSPFLTHTHTRTQTVCVLKPHPCPRLYFLNPFSDTLSNNSRLFHKTASNVGGENANKLPAKRTGSQRGREVMAFSYNVNGLWTIWRKKKGLYISRCVCICKCVWLGCPCMHTPLPNPWTNSASLPLTLNTLKKTILFISQPINLSIRLFKM